MPADHSQTLDLEKATQLCRLLADSTRLRLMHLLEHEELSVAELSTITQLAQPRVSTHLAKLKEANLVVDRREGVFVYYRITSRMGDSSLEALWNALRNSGSDPLVQQDLARAKKVLSARRGDTWADTVAGDMERHYSPGRTWEATAHGLAHLLRPGKVLDVASGDGVLAELLAPWSDHITCLDLSEKVVEAARNRLKPFGNVLVEPGDMHNLPVDDQAFDTVLLMHALTYTKKPLLVLKESARALKPGGTLLALTLQKHGHEKFVQPYDHANLGFTPDQLEKLVTKAGLSVISCRVSAVERRTPNFAVLSISARKPES